LQLGLRSTTGYGRARDLRRSRLRRRREQRFAGPSPLLPLVHFSDDAMRLPTVRCSSETGHLLSRERQVAVTGRATDLAVEPHLLDAAAIVLAFNHDGQPLTCGCMQVAARVW